MRLSTIQAICARLGPWPPFCAQLWHWLPSWQPHPLPQRGADEHPSLARARQEIDAVHFDRAHELLTEAHHGGGNDAKALVEIHRLLGEVSVALGREDDAKSHFSMLLALDPQASLGEMVSPKIAAAFEAARSELGDRALEVEHVLGSDNKTVAVHVKSDPLGTVAGALVLYRAQDGSEREHRQEGTGDLSVTLPADARRGVMVFTVDSHGNRLRGFYVGDLAEAAEPDPLSDPVAATPVAVTTDRDAPPIVARWWLWAGVAAGFATAGGVLSWRSSVAQGELDDVIDNSEEHFYSEAQALEDRAESRALWSKIAFGAAGAAAVASTILYFTGRSRAGQSNADTGAGWVPKLGESSAGIAWGARF